MIVAAEYPFNGGRAIRRKWPQLIQELEDIIAEVDASLHKDKTSKEKTKSGKVLYGPKSLNEAFGSGFATRGWQKERVQCDYSNSTAYYRSGYEPKQLNRRAFREIDFLKDRLGGEVQFGKYAFMVYNVCAKMTIFKNLGLICAGVEIVPVKSFADEMSSGVSYFEQFVWDLKTRGVADIDIPVLILGINA